MSASTGFPQASPVLWLPAAPPVEPGLLWLGPPLYAAALALKLAARLTPEDFETVQSAADLLFGRRKAAERAPLMVDLGRTLAAAAASSLAFPLAVAALMAAGPPPEPPQDLTTAVLALVFSTASALLVSFLAAMSAAADLASLWLFRVYGGLRGLAASVLARQWALFLTVAASSYLAWPLLLSALAHTWPSLAAMAGAAFALPASLAAAFAASYLTAPEAARRPEVAFGDVGAEGPRMPAKLALLALLTLALFLGAGLLHIAALAVGAQALAAGTVLSAAGTPPLARLLAELLAERLESLDL